MTKTDSLWLVLNETKKKFNFKMDEIAVRKIEMDSQLRIIKFPGSYVYSDPEKSIIDQYNSVYTFYRPIANKYKEVVLESESHFFELKALEKGVKAGKYDGNTKEFKLEYEELMKELLNGKEEAFEIAGKLNSVEPVYQRVVPKIDELLLQISEIQKK